jgi:hypothetical protein
VGDVRKEGMGYEGGVLWDVRKERREEVGALIV